MDWMDPLMGLLNLKTPEFTGFLRIPALARTKLSDQGCGRMLLSTPLILHRFVRSKFKGVLGWRMIASPFS